jgi:hypothetical protein
VLDNDTDAEANELTAQLVTDVEHGELTLAANGSFTYEPTVGFGGDVTFTYTATGNGLVSLPATVTIAVDFVLPGTVPASDATVTVTPSVELHGSVVVTGSGFEPFESVGLYLYPDQVLVGFAEADAAGNFSVTVPLTSVPAGAYTIVAFGDDHVGSDTVTVTPAAATIGSTPVVASAAPARAGTLPRTGSGIAALTTTGFALLVAGGTLHILRLRLRRRPVMA